MYKTYLWGIFFARMACWIRKLCSCECVLRGKGGGWLGDLCTNCIREEVVKYIVRMLFEWPFQFANWRHGAVRRFLGMTHGTHVVILYLFYSTRTRRWRVFSLKAIQKESSSPLHGHLIWKLKEWWRFTDYCWIFRIRRVSDTLADFVLELSTQSWKEFILGPQPRPLTDADY